MFIKCGKSVKWYLHLKKEEVKRNCEILFLFCVCINALMYVSGNKNWMVFGFVKNL